jgi:signal transduction histidine kinase
MIILLKLFLDYSRIGKHDGDVQTLNLQETVEHCYALLDIPEDFTINAPNIDVTLPKIPLELILTNLLSNAIKHHDKTAGTATVTCELLAHGYQIKVTDDGPGIESSLHQKIFKKFQTIKPRDEVEGSGLGLSMIEKALSNYNGKISVESEIGKGTTFIINWPRPGTQHT